MDGISSGAAVVGIAALGIQVSIKLSSLATQASIASERVTAIGNDVSLVSALLQQLGDLMQKDMPRGENSIFNENGLQTTLHAANTCKTIFKDLQTTVSKASSQLAENASNMPIKITLRSSEKAKWPFLQPKIDLLKRDLQDAKNTLMLMLQVTTLAFARKLSELEAAKANDAYDMQSMMRTILAIHNDHNDNANPTSVGSRKRRMSSSLAELPGSDTSTCWSPPCDGPAELDREHAAGETERPMTKDTYQCLLAHNPPGPPSVLPIELPSTDSRGSQDPLDQPNNIKLHPNPSKRALLLSVKPKLDDYFDKVELTWTSQTVELTDSYYLDDLSRSRPLENRDLSKMLHGINDYEQSIISQFKITHGPFLDVSKAKRTKTDIFKRNILFRELPGLQIVFQDRSSDTSTGLCPWFGPHQSTGNMYAMAQPCAVSPSVVRREAYREVSGAETVQLADKGHTQSHTTQSGQTSGAFGQYDGNPSVNTRIGPRSSAKREKYRPGEYLFAMLITYYVNTI